jgi:hypothetical protein
MVPVSQINIVKCEDFREGCLESVRKYLAFLIDKYPKLKEISHFVEFVKKVGL